MRQRGIRPQQGKLLDQSDMAPQESYPILRVSSSIRGVQSFVTALVVVQRILFELVGCFRGNSRRVGRTSYQNDLSATSRAFLRAQDARRLSYDRLMSEY